MGSPHQNGPAWGRSSSKRFVVMQGLAQVIPIVTAPIITRLYTSEAYGALGVFGAISAIGMALATGRYQRATIVAEDDEVLQTTRLALTINTVVCAVFLVVLAATYPLWHEWHTFAPLGMWVFVIPVATWLLSTFDCMLHYHLRHGNLARLNGSAMAMTVVNSGGTIGLGTQGLGASGTIAGTVMAQTVATAYISGGYRREAKRSPWDRAKLSAVARRYIDFPKFDVAANLAVILTYNIIPLGLGVLYSVGTVGFYAIAYRLLALPADFLGTSLGQLFFKNLSANKEDRETARRLFRKTLIATSLAATPCLLIFPLGPALFALFFGESWRQGGVIAIALAPHVLARLISTPVFGVFAVYDRNRELMVSQFLILATTLGLFGAAAINDWSATTLLTTHSLAAMVIYFGTLARAHRILASANSSS